MVRADPDRRVIQARQLQALWRRSDIALQDKTFWRLAYDSAARAGELLGLDLADLGWTLHQLRHTRIRELKDQGCPLPVLQKITGHRSLRTLTEHYPGPSPEAVRAWYDSSNPAARRRHGASASG